VTDIVIQAENLGKKYTIGHQTERGGYLALRAQGHALRDPARGFEPKHGIIGTRAGVESFMSLFSDADSR
jgi:hypothetical protein